MENTKLAKHAAIYGASSILAQASSLLMVPIFTRNMSQEQFGQYNLLISVQTLLAIFITLGIFSGMTRFIYEFEDQNRTKNIVLTFSLAWGSVMCVLSLIFGDYLYELAFPHEEGGGFYINFLVFSSVLLCLISIYISYYTMLLKPQIVSVTNLGRALLMLLFSAYFIKIRQGGVYGAFQAQMYTYSAVLAGLILYDRKHIRLVLAWQELKVILKYSVGLLPGEASAWIYTLIDRYFIKVMMGLNQVAVYSMGYRIGMMMDPILISPFKSVFTSFKYKNYNEADAPEKFREFYVIYNFFGLFCVLGFSVFAKPVITLLSTEEYAEAFKLVPLIVFSYYLFGLGEFYSLGIHIKNKSIYSSYILGIGAGSNILLNIVLIPTLGIMGAALATILSYFIMNILFFLIGRKYLDLGLSYFQPFKGVFLFFGLYAVYFAAYRFVNNVFWEILFSSLICLVFIFFGILGRLIPRELAAGLFSRFVRKIGLVKPGDNGT